MRIFIKIKRYVKNGSDFQHVLHRGKEKKKI